VPIVDRVAAVPGLILATGMAGHGFGIGPGFGWVIADMALGRSPRHDLSAFRFARFSDGSPRYHGTAL
jgi:glycine/D-amino acid oxidase-like deaminating enzyme